MDDRYLEFVEDVTFHARAPRDDKNVPENLKRFRELWRARDYGTIITLAHRTPNDPDACAYESMALRALGRIEESMTALFRGLRLAKEDKKRLAKLYNQLAVRIYMVAEDERLAELIASHAWNTSSEGRDGGWSPVLNQCEMKLIRARTSCRDMSKILSEIDILIGDLLDHFPEFEKDQQFINYMHRALGIKEYRESDLWKKRFGHTKAH